MLCCFRNWNLELRKLQTGKKPSLIIALLKTFGLRYAIWGVVAVIVVRILHRFIIVQCTSLNLQCMDWLQKKDRISIWQNHARISVPSPPPNSGKLSVASPNANIRYNNYNNKTLVAYNYALKWERCNTRRQCDSDCYTTLGLDIWCRRALALTYNNAAWTIVIVLHSVNTVRQSRFLSHSAVLPCSLRVLASISSSFIHSITPLLCRNSYTHRSMASLQPNTWSF